MGGGGLVLCVCMCVCTISLLVEQRAELCPPGGGRGVTKALPEYTGWLQMALGSPTCAAPQNVGKKECLPTFGDASELGLGDAKVVELQAIKRSRFKAAVLQGFPPISRRGSLSPEAKAKHLSPHAQGPVTS